MIKVLHVIDKLSMDGVNPSSCAQLFVQWIPRHDPARFKVMVANLRPKDRAGQFVEDSGIEVFYINKGKFSFGNVRAIESLIEEHDIDILHLHGYSSANFGRLAARRKSIPSVMHEHAILKTLPHQYLADRLLRDKTDVAVAVSQAVGDFLTGSRSVPKEKIRVIWNGIDLQSYRHPERERCEQFRSRFGQPHQKLVGTVTRLRKEKGNRYFIEAAHRIAAQSPEVRFVIVGDGPERAELEALVTRLDLTERVHFAGFVTDVAAALSSFDIAVIPSLREGFGLALAEAMAAGRPIVATNVGGMREMAEHEVHALLVPPANSPALAQAIGRVLANAKLAARLAREARAHSESFSIERNVRELEALYASLASNCRN